MATKIQRKTAVVFGGSLAAAAGGLEEFGTTANGGAVYSTDLAAIQNSYWLEGWPVAAKNNYPVLEDLNSVDYVASSQIAYILQQGIAEWDLGTEYFTNSFCSYNGLIFQSLSDSNLNNTPSVGSANWQILGASSARGSNLFRNSSMQAAQRGTTGTVTAGVPVYTLDGWMVGSTGGNVTWTQGWGSATGQPAYIELQRATGTITDTLLKQRIDSATCKTIPQSAYITVQFSVDCFATFTPTIAINYASGGGNNNFSSVTPLVAATNLQQCVTGVNTVSYTFQQSGLTSQGLEIILDLGAELQTNRVYISQPDICVTNSLNAVGQQATPPTPQIRPAGLEVAFNEMFFYTFQGALLECIGIGACFSTTQAEFFIPQLKNMLGTPTILSGSFTVLVDYTSAGSSNPSAYSISEVNKLIVTGTSLTQGGTAQLRTGNSGNYFSFSSEL